MFMQILTNTPKWVFALFIALVWLGLKQMLPRRVGLNRMAIMPLAMTGLSLFGVTSAFGYAPQALLTWLAGAAAAGFINYQTPVSNLTTYDSVGRSFQLPGSVVPLALFMGIFFTKYAVGISMGVQPSLAHNSSFAMGIGALYGVFSGIFLARAAKLWRIALAQAKTSMQKTTLA